MSSRYLMFPSQVLHFVMLTCNNLQFTDAIMNFDYIQFNVIIYIYHIFEIFIHVGIIFVTTFYKQFTNKKI